MRKLLIVAAALGLGACPNKNGGDKPVESNEIVVGEYGSMTGSEATFGQSTHNGLTLAVDEINAAGGIKGKQVKLINYDDQGKTSEVGTAVTRLITNDHALAIIGEVASSLSIAGGQIAQQHGVPMISPSSTNPKVTETGDYVFRVCFIDPFQGYVMARFATDATDKSGLGIKKVAILIDQRQAYAQGLAKDFESSLIKLGGAITDKESYQGGDQDFSAQLTKIKSSAPEAIFIPGYYTDVANIAKQARQLGITVPLLGGDGWESVQDIGGDAIQGAFFSNHYSSDEKRPEVQQFVDKYVKRYGKKPDSMAALSYDAMMLLKNAIERAPKIDHKEVRDAIAATKDFQGVTGKITMDANRNATKPAVVLKIVGKSTTAAASIPPP
ncbi:MAG TPA: ABC transporter substrate-binding protein [Polyangia bacterium]|nr:ABC transporter substrate-binding protein [Polyangia bacterium]